LNRAWRKRLGFGAVKGLTVYVFHFALRFRNLVPRFLYSLIIFSGATFFKITWFVPFHPWRMSAANILELGGTGPSPRHVFFKLVDGCRFVATAFLDAHRRGVETVLPRIRITEKARGLFEEVARNGKGAIVVLPHVLGGIFSAALITTQYKTLILSRGPRYPKRAEIQRKFMEPLGLKLLVLDRSSAILAARQFLKALKGGHLIVGTTDMDYKREDSVRTTIFGQDVDFPSWPARFSRQTKTPILPGYVRVREGYVEVDLADPIQEKDLSEATDAWALAFERMILQSPQDWAFLCDLRWGKLLQRAVHDRGSKGNSQPETVDPNLETP
jgi:lauroyl/myristoyl acyltransferase